MDRVVVCLLAFGCLQLWNLLHYAITLMSLVLLTSVVGQLDGACEDLCGPFHHNVEGENVEGSIPLEMRSAGLD